MIQIVCAVVQRHLNLVLVVITVQNLMLSHHVGLVIIVVLEALSLIHVR
jgi:hypothetical protein